MELKHTIKLIGELNSEIAEIETEIKKIMDAIDSPILSVPGIGQNIGAIIVAEIGDFVEKRNEITKEHPFQFVKRIEISVFFPYGGTHVLTKTFAVENDTELRIPLSSFDRHPLFSGIGDDYFKKFVLMNVVIGTTDLMPTFMIVFGDDTFELDSFHGGLKTTIYRKNNEIATRVAKEDIIEIYLMMTYTALPMNEQYLQMTSKERLDLGTEDVLTFMEITTELRERECYFEQTKIQDKAYILKQLFNLTPSLNLGKTNMYPIIEAFKSKETK